LLIFCELTLVNKMASEPKEQKSAKLKIKRLSWQTAIFQHIMERDRGTKFVRNICLSELNKNEEKQSAQ